MDKKALKAEVASVINSNAEHIIEIGREILDHPELGFKEYRTAELVQREFQRLSLRTRAGLAVTGVRGYLEGRGPGPHVAVFGELDSVISRGHPKADLTTGAAHACGHNAQVAGMLGAAMGLVGSGASDYLAGTVSFIGVPAEELIEVEFRQELRNRGVLQYLLGKQQLIAEGELKGVDISIQFHLKTQDGSTKITHRGTHNGALAKFVRYSGREAHAGGAPHLGINALNAAVIGLTAINAQRETLKDQDNIRIHPIITKGGDLVNTVPADVTMEMFVRGKTVEAIQDASAKVNRALKAGADAVGATCEIASVPGYMPRQHHPPLEAIFGENARELVGEAAVGTTPHHPSCTDMGDVSQVMPGLHPYFLASAGVGHTQTYRIVDEELAYLTSAKAMAWTVIDLLWEDGEKGREVAESYKRPFNSVEEYSAAWRKMGG